MTIRTAGVGAIAALVLAASPVRAQEALPGAVLEVKVRNEWLTVWDPARAPRRWSRGDASLDRIVPWRLERPGVEAAELTLRGRGEPWRIRLILLRIDPRAVVPRLEARTRAGGTRGGWSLADAAGQAAVAMNAGQFRGGKPWGWVIRDGEEVQAPGSGALAMGVVVDGAGAFHLVPPEEIEKWRGGGAARLAFQSYPMLLHGDGHVPTLLGTPGRGINLAHRDARLALGRLRDGRLLVALTRMEGLGAALEILPFGPTVPEMAGLMGALGCGRAVLLDGGISAQLAVRNASGQSQEWRGLRRVPLAVELWPAADAPVAPRAR